MKAHVLIKKILAVFFINYWITTIFLTFPLLAYIRFYVCKYQN